MTTQLIDRQQLKADARALVLPILARIRMMRASSAIRKAECMREQLEQEWIEQQVMELSQNLKVRC